MVLITLIFTLALFFEPFDSLRKEESVFFMLYGWFPFRIVLKKREESAQGFISQAKNLPLPRIFFLERCLSG